MYDDRTTSLLYEGREEAVKMVEGVRNVFCVYKNAALLKFTT